jgi:hypothetical protein
MGIRIPTYKLPGDPNIRFITEDNEGEMWFSQMKKN